MKTIELEIEQNPQPKGLQAQIEKAKPQFGDLIKIVSADRKERISTMVVVGVLMGVARYMGSQARSKSILSKIEESFKTLSLEELQKQIEVEYGIKCEVQNTANLENEEWYRFANINLNNAYTENEPDISHLQFRELNLDYKKL